MNDDKNFDKRRESLILTDRQQLILTGVTDIDSFDEEVVVVYLDDTELCIKGMGLHINKIDVDRGELDLEGEIHSLCYQGNTARGQSFFSRLFR